MGAFLQKNMNLQERRIANDSMIAEKPSQTEGVGCQRG